MVEREEAVAIDDVASAFGERKLKPAVSLLRQLLTQPSVFRMHEPQIAQLANEIAEECVKSGYEREAAAVYRLLLWDEWGLLALQGKPTAETQSKLLRALVNLGQATPRMLSAN